jgi:hypothetical protein
VALLREVKRRGLAALSPQLTIADVERKPTPMFLAWWRKAFGYAANMPNPTQPLLEATGAPSALTLDLWEALT